MSNKNDTKMNIKATVMRLLIDKPFFGFIVSKMDFIEDKDSYVGPIPTAATDGRNIFYNAEFFNNMAHKERIFVIAHEIMHCVLDSMGRKGGRDMQYWNMATDYAINDLLILDKVGEMPKLGLHDTKYRGMTAEVIYEDLVKNQASKKDTLDVHLDPDQMQKGEQEGKGASGKDGGKQPQPGDGPGKGKAPTKKEMEQIRKEFEKLKIEAYQRAKMAGTNLGGIEQMVGELLTPKINWKQLLNTSIQSIFKSDMTWMRPNRRNPMKSMILPSMDFEKTVDVCVSIDTSGSISDEQRITFLSEISGILNYYSSFKLKIWCFDTACHNLKQYDQYNINDLKNYQPAGGGGTDIGCNFDFMKEQGIKPAQFICLTDGYNCSPSWGPESYCPTTWIIHSNPNPQVPFGRHAIYEELVDND
jgi:predicted metal-dependent peptidase